MTIDPAVVAERVANYQERIAAHAVAPVTLLAVTKGFGSEAVLAAQAAGLHAVGENFAQEVVAKHAALDGEQPEWHFIGQLQTNKVRSLASLVSVWQSVDRPSLVTELAKRAPGARVFIQVNVTDDPERGGSSWTELPDLVTHARDRGLVVEGLMTVGALGEPEERRGDFRRLARTAEALELREVSMGMSDDFEIAVQEGATLVRLGRALFGER